MTEILPAQQKKQVAPDMAPQRAAFGGIRVRDAYEELEQIGVGGMGVVSLARDRALGRYVAIKRLRPERRSDEVLRSRFLREARAAAALSSAHIAHIYAIGEDEDGPYLAMEYVESALPPATPGAPRPPQTLEKRVEEGGTLRPREALSLVLKIGRAVETAHAAGIVHRDLKPANILLDAAGEPKIVDFGLAHLSEGFHSASSAAAALTQPGEKLLSLGYGAPEQEEDASECTERTDVYGLGAILYYAITGKNPRFFREDDLPVSARPLLSKALATDPDRRHQGAAAFNAEVAALLSEPRTAVPTVRTTWRCKWCDTINPMEKRFCDGCGWNGQVHCLECDAEMRFGIQFCGVCGANQATYEAARNTLGRIDRAEAAKDFSLVVALAAAPQTLEPAGVNGRRILSAVHERGADAAKALARAASLREAIPIEWNAGNFERAEKAMRELRTLSAAAADQHEDDLSAVPRKIEERDLDRAERAVATKDWTMVERMANSISAVTEEGKDRLARLRRIIAKRAFRARVLKVFGALVALFVLYVFFAPVLVKAGGSISKLANPARWMARETPLSVFVKAAFSLWGVAL